MGVILSIMILREIAKAIEESDKSRYRIAKDTGVDAAALRRLMQGVKGCVSVEKCDILCKYLGLELKPKESRKRGKHGKC